MATWVRNGTGTYPSATDADVLGTMELDNGTVPGDFDPDAVNSVRIQYSMEVISGTFAPPEDHTVLRDVNLQLDGVGTIIATVNGTPTDLDNGTSPIVTDLTDSSIATGFSIAQWEGAELNPVNVASVLAWTTYNQNMGKDGVAVGIVSGSVTVTIDYEPASEWDKSGSGSIVETHTVAGTGDKAGLGAGSIVHGHTVVATGSGPVTSPVRRETSSGFDESISTTYDVILDGGAAIAGDLAVVHIIGSQSSGPVTDPGGIPAGWTKLFIRSHTDYSYSLFWKILTADDLTNSPVTFNFDGSGGFHAHQLDIITKDTFDSADPIDVTDEDFPTTTDNATVSVITTGVDELLLIYAGVDISTTGTWTIDTGDENFDSTLGPDDLSIAGYESGAATATTYNRTVTSTATSQDLHGLMIAVNAAVGNDKSGSGAIIETHTVVGEGGKQVSGDGSISHGHTVMSAGDKAASGAGSISHGHTVVASGFPLETHSGSGSIVETHTVVAAGDKAGTGAGSINHGHTVVGAGFKTVGEDKSGSGAIVETHTVEGSGHKDVIGTGASTNPHTVVAQGVKAGLGSGNISHGHTIVATGIKSVGEAHSGSGAIIEVHTVVGSGSKQVIGTGNVSNGHTIVAAGFKTENEVRSGSGSIVETHTIVGEGSKEVTGTAAIGHGHTVVATGFKGAIGTATLTLSVLVVATGFEGEVIYGPSGGRATPPDFDIASVNSVGHGSKVQATRGRSTVQHRSTSSVVSGER